VNSLVRGPKFRVRRAAAARSGDLQMNTRVKSKLPQPEPSSVDDVIPSGQFEDEGDDESPLLNDTLSRSGWRTTLHRRVSDLQRLKKNAVVGVLTVLLIMFIVLAFMAWRLFDRGDRIPHGENPQVLIHASNGAVATELDVCSEIGVKLLKEGGNAVDAAIASGICIGSINMFSAGIGGYLSPGAEANRRGGFMVVRHPNSTAKVFNFRETAPAGSSKSMYDGSPESSLFGGLSVGVPGEIAGYAEASRMFGNLPWKRLFQESIEMMRHGIPVPVELVRRMQRFKDFIVKDPDWAFLYPNGTLLQENDILYRTNFSYTLEKIAEEGPQVFYNGSISESLVAHIQATGGIMTAEDMANYTVSIEEPIHGWYRGHEVITCGAPCSGPALLLALNILEGYSFRGAGHVEPVEVHLLVEAMKRSRM
jgi:gamma-glutamyltranspeptidase / glutathione hydrolase / leukotriene-C4 hydrolase